MKLDETQRQKVTAWIDAGLKLSEIQKHLETEFGFRMTYLDVRLLVDELRLTPKDPVPPTPPPAPAVPAPAEAGLEPEVPALEPEPEGMPAGKVSVTVDQLTQPGAVVSGKVTFSDGKTAKWFLDQTGRLGIAAAEKGYKPSPGDVQLFQMELQEQLQKLGF